VPEHLNVKNKNGRLDQYGAGSSKQQQFGSAGVEGVKRYVLGSKPCALLSKLGEAQPKYPLYLGATGRPGFGVGMWSLYTGPAWYECYVVEAYITIPRFSASRVYTHHEFH